MTVLGDKLQEALDIKKEDVNSYVWKGPRVNGVQEEFKLIDADYDTLKKWYNRCITMLNNTDVHTPGRLVLVNIIDDQIARCRAELLMRWLRKEKQYTNIKCLQDLRQIIANNKEVLTPETIKTYPICEVMSGLPIEFQTVSVGNVLDACMDLLGVFDCSHVTRNFIVKMGLWFTPQELQNELCQRDPNTGKPRNRLEVVREILKVEPAIRLRISETGLTFNEFKAIFNIQKDKYSSYSSEQLNVLANKILYRLQNQCEEQAKQWQDKANEIAKVANIKGWDVTR
jgi:hypothetical protein